MTSASLNTFEESIHVPISLDSLIQEYPTTGSLFPSIETKSLGVLSVSIAPEVLSSGILPGVPCQKLMFFTAGVIPLVETHAFWMTRNDLGLTICSEQSDALLMNALEIQAKSNHLPLSVGLAYGA